MAAGRRSRARDMLGLIQCVQLAYVGSRHDKGNKALKKMVNILEKQANG